AGGGDGFVARSLQRHLWLAGTVAAEHQGGVAVDEAGGDPAAAEIVRPGGRGPGRQRVARPDPGNPAVAPGQRAILDDAIAVGIVQRGQGNPDRQPVPGVRCAAHGPILALAGAAGENARMHAATDTRPLATRTDAGWRLPGIPNLHSHAFQRAMAGMAERQTDPEDSFWTWRETMYRMAARFSPDTLQVVAAQLYAEMLEAGYTTVCEFHYLHHDADGKPYDDPAAMSRALIAAARETGIRLTLLPVLYMSGGFDGRALGERQRRFGHGVDAYLRLVETLRSGQDEMLKVGCALHSLRAVPADAMQAVLAVLPGDMPVHIHIAEQVGEVQDCVALRGARPVEWLLDNARVDARWTLVHATHLEQAEVKGIARSGATVAICPTTEANLGDGLFPLRGFLAVDGGFGIGSDSH